MFSLIQSEIKKLIKQKGLIGLFIVGILLGVYQGNQFYQNYNERGFLEKEYANEQGEVLSQTELLLYVDEVIHRYQGKVTQATYAQIQQDYQTRLKQYNNMVIDEKKMKSIYGKDYQELLDGKINVSYIEDYMKENTDFDYDSNEDGRIKITVFYKNDPIINTIHLIYDDLLNQYRFLVQDSPLPTGHTSKEFHHYYQSLFNQHKDYFESPLSMNMFLMCVEKILMIPLLICVIVFANCFGQERQYHVEPLIYATQSTKYKISLAKVISVLTVSFIYMLLFIGISYALSCFYLPIRSFETMQMNMAQTYLSATGGLFVPMCYQYILIWGIGLVSVGFLAIMSLLLGLSYSLKKRFLVVMIMLGIVLGGICVIDVEVILDIIRSFIPVSMLTFTKFFSGFVNTNATYPYIIGESIIAYKSLVTLFWCIVSCTVIIGLCWHAKKGKHFYL